MKAYTRYFRATSFAVLTVALVGLIAILVVLLLLVLDAAEEAQAPQKRSLLMMAYLAPGCWGWRRCCWWSWRPASSGRA